jgi:uncharacterized protein (TIGR00251 family)
LNLRRNAPDADAPWMRISIDEVTIEVAAKPGASNRGVVRATSDALVIRLNSAPEKGNANFELIEYLAEQLRVPRSAVMIVRGNTSRRKTIRIVTHQPAKVAARLRELATFEKTGTRK